MADIIKPENTSVVICCAGMGTRLGIGTTKALVDICGKPLIIRQLEQLELYDDIRIVVGFDAEKVIKIVKQYRKDIMFVFNYDYMHNGPADSLRKALLGIREYIITIDGDTIHNPNDFHKFLLAEKECVAVSKNSSLETVGAYIDDHKVQRLALGFNDIQWSGIAKIASNKIVGLSQHTYEVIDQILPLDAFYIRLREINTQDDYDRAIEWFQTGMRD
ncbi:NTP transferase domain-containing protein [Phascolarctobacterium sp.]